VIRVCLLLNFTRVPGRRQLTGTAHPRRRDVSQVDPMCIPLMLLTERSRPEPLLTHHPAQPAMDHLADIRSVLCVEKRVRRQVVLAGWPS